jgi:membrane-associated protease RseP (regulator of RpoE activity)
VQAQLLELFDLLEKTAAEADSLEQENAQLRTQLAARPEGSKTAAAVPAFSPQILEKLAQALHREGFLPENMSKDAAARLISQKPDTLADLTLQIITPPPSEGVAVDSVEKQATLKGGAKIVKVQGRQLADYAGWSRVFDFVDP